MEQKSESERLKIGQEVVCSKHGSQVIKAIDDSVPQGILYILSCGDVYLTEKENMCIGHRRG